MRMRLWLISGVLGVAGFSACSTRPSTTPEGDRDPDRAIKPGEGKVAVPGGKVWYRIVGSGKGTPVIFLHGGPGFPSDYLQPLEALGEERPVIFYDQLGCGKSDRPDDTKLWHIDRFVEELAELRKALGLERVHVYAHSWGTTLAVEYLLTKPQGVKGLILASPCISMPRWVEDQNRYRAALPKEVQAVLDRHENAGTTESKEYEEATMVFYKRHLCRLDPFPPAMQKSEAGMNPLIYRTMWGPSEFSVTGNLKGFDRTGRLREISVPTLFTCGQYDEATPATTKFYQSLLPGSELAVFHKSAHMPHLEEGEAYLTAVREFLRRIDQNRATSGRE